MARVSVPVRRTWRERAIAGLLFVTMTPFAVPVSAQPAEDKASKMKEIKDRIPKRPSST